MFELKTIGPADRDCWQYDVIFDKEYTVQEFIQAAVFDKPTEWGSIGVYNRGHIFGYPCIMYSKGEIISDPTVMDEVLERKVSSVHAMGGWSRMDYWLILEE